MPPVLENLILIQPTQSTGRLLPRDSQRVRHAEDTLEQIIHDTPAAQIALTETSRPLCGRAQDALAFQRDLTVTQATEKITPAAGARLIAQRA